MAKDGKRGLAPEQWVEARDAYKHGELVASIAKRYEIRWATIDARRKREGWTVDPSVVIDAQTAKTVHAQAQAQVVDLASRRALDTPEGIALIAEAKRAIEEQVQAEITIRDALARTAAIADSAAQFMEKFLKKAFEGSILPGERQSEADVAASAMTAYARWNATTREAAGRRNGQASMPDGSRTMPTGIRLRIAAAPVEPVPEPQVETA